MTVSLVLAESVFLLLLNIHGDRASLSYIEIVKLTLCLLIDPGLLDLAFALFLFLDTL
jgi:hypothetical protein